MIPRPPEFHPSSNFGPPGAAIERLQVRQRAGRRQASRPDGGIAPGNSLDACARRSETKPERLRHERFGDHPMSSYRAGAGLVAHSSVLSTCGLAMKLGLTKALQIAETPRPDEEQRDIEMEHGPDGEHDQPEAPCKPYQPWPSAHPSTMAVMPARIKMPGHQ